MNTLHGGWNFPLIVNELFKTLLAVSGGLFLGWIAYKRGLFGQTDWDRKKLRYDVFKTVKLLRIDRIQLMCNLAHLMLEASKQYEHGLNQEADAIQQSHAENIEYWNKKNLDDYAKVDALSAELRRSLNQYGKLQESEKIFELIEYHRNCLSVERLYRAGNSPPAILSKVAEELLAELLKALEYEQKTLIDAVPSDKLNPFT